MSSEITSNINKVCTKPDELLGLFNCWKYQYLYISAEQRIIKPLRIFTFGIYLARETFPSSKKFPFPPVIIDRFGKVKTASMLIVKHGKDDCFKAEKIVVNESWLVNPNKEKTLPKWTFDTSKGEGVFKLISSGVEEYAHWTLHLAMEKYRDSEYINSVDTHYDDSSEKFDRLLNIDHSGLDTLESTNFLQFFYLTLTGKMSRRLKNANVELEKITAALLDHELTVEEYMGTVWRNKIAQRYFPWTSTARRVADKLVELASEKQKRAGN